MSDLLLLEELRDYLIAQNIGRDPSTTGSLPTIWLHPRDGAVQPGRDKTRLADETCAITLMDSGGFTLDVLLQPFLAQPTIDVIVRAHKNAEATLVQRQIRGALADKRLLTMGDLLIEESRVWREDQPLAADDLTYDRIQSFRFTVRVKALAGLPYAP